MHWVLVTAGVYNLLCGLSIILRPLNLFRLLGMPPPNHPEIWQGTGMLIGAIGLGYLVSATNPLRHWPIVLAGLLTKICAAIGFLDAAAPGRWLGVLGGPSS